jgi:hypothetical protein
VSRHIEIRIEDWGPVPSRPRVHTGISVIERDEHGAFFSVDVQAVDKEVGDEFRRQLWERLDEPFNFPEGAV